MQIGHAAASALGGMRAASQLLEQSAQNVANADSPGYTADGGDTVSLGGTQAASSAANYAAFGAASSADSIGLQGASGAAGTQSDTDLATEAVSQLSSLRAFQANVAVFRTADAMTGELLNQKA
jgi:flagellar hook protein FlgE